MDCCSIDHCTKAAAVILPTIVDDIALCIAHARPILAVSDLIPAQREPVEHCVRLHQEPV